MAYSNPDCTGFCPSCIAETAKRYAPLKMPDADIVYLPENLAIDTECNEAFRCADGEMCACAHRMETTRAPPCPKPLWIADMDIATQVKHAASATAKVKASARGWSMVSQEEIIALAFIADVFLEDADPPQPSPAKPKPAVISNV